MTIHLWHSRKGCFHEELSVKPDNGTRKCQHLEDSVPLSNLSVIDLLITIVEYVTSSLSHNLPYHAIQNGSTYLGQYILERKWRKLGLAEVTLE